jgi:hypothetical protein
VNKRNVPDYYEIIKEPMALSILKQKINKREYKNFAEFVRDCALVSFAAFSLPLWNHLIMAFTHAVIFALDPSQCADV